MDFERLSAEGLSTGNAYRVMTDIIAPRPIAWVSTRSATGRGNLAPYSYFQAVCSNPPTVIIGMGRRSEGGPKDSLRNILETQRFTICHVTEAEAEAMNATSAAYAEGVDEAAALGVEMVEEEGLFAPRTAGCKAAMACVLQHAIPLGPGAGRGAGNEHSSTLVIARIEAFYLRPGLLEYDPRGRIQSMDPAGLEAVGRLGGVGYTTTRERFELSRPPKPQSDDAS